MQRMSGDTFDKHHDVTVVLSGKKYKVYQATLEFEKDVTDEKTSGRNVIDDQLPGKDDKVVLRR